MQTPLSSYSFQLSSGGLIYWLFIRGHLLEPGKYHTKRRIFLFCGLSWLPLMLLSAYEGNLINSDITVSYIYDIKPYIRYLIALPLLIAADAVIDPLIAMVIRYINSSDILPEDGKPAFNKAFQILDRRNNSFVADVVIIGFTFLISWSYLANLDRLDVYLAESSWASILKDDHYDITYAGWWFLFISSPLLQIMLFRWLWRFFIWCEFLFRVSRIKLALEPTHPDLSGGLGILKNSQNAFIIIFVALGTMLSVSLAQDILYTDDTVTLAEPVILGFIVTSLVITSLPLLFFSHQLIMAKLQGRVVYGVLGYKLSRAFDEKWGKTMDSKTGRNLLDVTDNSSVCDYSDIYDAVKNMRFIPITLREYLVQAVLLMVPFVPLIFLEMSFTDLVKRFFDTLI